MAEVKDRDPRVGRKLAGLVRGGVVPENRLLAVITAFGRFQGKSLRTLESAVRLDPYYLDRAEATLHELARSLRQETSVDFRAEACALADRIEEDLA